jgi:hypothetical protein
VLQLSTHTIGSPLRPPLFAVSVPETVNEAPGPGLGCDADAVSIVEVGFGKDPVLRFRVIAPGPVKETIVGSVEPEQANPPEQFQLDKV